MQNQMEKDARFNFVFVLSFVVPQGICNTVWWHDKLFGILIEKFCFYTVTSRVPINRKHCMLKYDILQDVFSKYDLVNSDCFQTFYLLYLTGHRFLSNICTGTWRRESKSVRGVFPVVESFKARVLVCTRF